LEEFGRILNSPKEKIGPYIGIEQIPKLEELALALNVPFSDLTTCRNYQTNGNVPGFRRDYPEKKAREFEDVKDWESFGDMLALLIFELVMFPNKKKNIDTAAVSVFWAVKVRGEDPVSALL
jgi:hypothetical protein